MADGTRHDGLNGAVADYEDWIKVATAGKLNFDNLTGAQKTFSKAQLGQAVPNCKRVAQRLLLKDKKHLAEELTRLAGFATARGIDDQVVTQLTKWAADVRVAPSRG